jgi:hypothetical protein
MAIDYRGLRSLYREGLPIACERPVGVVFEKVVSLLEILRAYVHLFCRSSWGLAGIASGMGEAGIELKDSVLLSAELRDLGQQCEFFDLPVTEDKIADLSEMLGMGEIWPVWPASVWASHLNELRSRLESELSHRLFLHMRSDRAKYFDEPRAGWESILEGFPECIVDVEEMRRCFALSRYPACVFHSLQVLELGVVRLGEFMGCADHKKGWDATSNELKKIAKKAYSEKDNWEKRHFQFLEQMDGAVEALKTAWRNKISHAAERLHLIPGGAFAPDIAEEIMAATRAFMRRLATEMPPPEDYRPRASAV